MKSWFTYIFIALYMFGIVSCTEDDLVKENYFDKVIVSLKLNVPGAESRVGGSYQPGSSTQNPYDDDLDEQTDYQRYIDDVHILLFEHKTDGSGKLLDATTTTLADKKQGQVTRTINGQFTKHTTSVDIVVLANLNQNGFKIEWDGLKDKTESAIYSGLVFSYPDEKWVLGKQARFLPMYGKKTNVTLNQSEISIDNFHLYRGVAKMGVQVASTCNNFIMKEIYVYHINEAGNFVSSKPLVEKTVSTGEKTNQYLLPDVPSGSKLRNVPIIYELSSEQEKSFLEQIYLLESDNKSPDLSEAEKLKVVVGGIYNGTGLVENNQISYYRIDMKDDKENPGGTKTDFDIVRNHSYIFNITTVLNPGTPTPDEALDEAVVGLKVEVEDWVDEPMRGVPDQYRLTTNKSVIQYASSTDREPQDLEIFTDYSDGWHIEWPGDKPVDWLTISKTTGEDNVTTEISLTPNNINQGVTRFARFYVVAGNIMKEITVIQPQPPTANCYVRDNGIHELIVSIKGNGNDGIMPENHDIVPGEGDASIEPDKIGIIWETHGGLVKLLDPNDTPVTNTPGSVSYVDYNRTTNTIKYKVDMIGASIGGKSGGNALIGAFKNTAKEGQNPRYEVIWSWHIWVCPELIDSETQIIKDECVENWTLNSYYVLDRNLGALADRPVETQEDNTKSVASMGLLYQWGRKDPFIGAAYSNDNYPEDDLGILDVVHYYEDWAVTQYNKSITDNLKTTVIEETIAHPTKLIYDYTYSNRRYTYYGMSSLAENGGYLWGTNNGLSTTVKDLGSKTIYDPCPVGYRVPPVDAFVFTAKGPVYKKGDFVESFTVNAWGGKFDKDYGYPVYYSTSQNGGNGAPDEDGHISVTNWNRYNQTYYVYQAIATTENRVLVSSETDNWRINLIYVPHHVDDMTDSSYQWGDDITPSTQSSSIFIYEGDYVENAEYYGFYLNYTEMKEPKLTNDIYTYGDDDGDYYYYKPQANQTITWLPLTGAYDPSQGFTLNGTKIEEYSSVSVNSFLWTNSSVNNEDGWIPGAMFLHGTEDGGSRGSGRHIHDLTASDIKAEPHYAGAVRCVKDVPKDKWDINSLTDQIPISSQEGSTTEITIKSVNADWELVDPGAPWLQVTPDKGSADKGQGTTITLKMLTEQPAGTTTTLVFQIANETEPRQCVVTVQ